VIAIDKGVPLPPDMRGSGKYPWRIMEPGDSFFVPGADARKFSAQVTRMKEVTGRDFTSRPVEGGVRVWRVS
jgi:hypothetical protein